MKTLLSKNLHYFLAYTTLILIGCFPLLYLSMHYYAKDLDKLILYRADDFITATLPEFTQQEIPIWNKYNEDIQIQPFDPEKPLLKYLSEPYYNRGGEFII